MDDTMTITGLSGLVDFGAPAGTPSEQERTELAVECGGRHCRVLISRRGAGWQYVLYEGRTVRIGDAFESQQDAVLAALWAIGQVSDPRWQAMLA